MGESSGAVILVLSLVFAVAAIIVYGACAADAWSRKKHFSVFGLVLMLVLSVGVLVCAVVGSLIAFGGLGV